MQGILGHAEGYNSKRKCNCLSLSKQNWKSNFKFPYMEFPYTSFSKEKEFNNKFDDWHRWVFIKYVRGGVRGFYKFLKKYLVAQGTIELYISDPSSLFVKNFMTPPINFSSLFKACLP